MNTIVRIIFLLLSTITLISCAFIAEHSGFQNRDKEYLTARSIPPLKIPPCVSSQSFHSYYPVSPREYPESRKDVSIVPPGLYENQ